MKTTDLPLWRQMYSPTGSDDELTELRSALSYSSECSETLEKFLFAEWATLVAKARVELNPVLREQFKLSADTLAEIAGKIYAKPKQKTTESKML